MQFICIFNYVNKEIEKLLTLQSKDAALSAIKSRLDSVPKEIDAKRAGIRAAEAQCALTRNEIESREKLRMDMRTQRRTLEEKIFKYKNQLTEVKKNDDYIAINAEIDRLIKSVSEMEEEELEILFQIDEKKQTLANVEEAAKKQIEAIEEEIAIIEAAKSGIAHDFAAVSDEVVRAREQIEPIFLKGYDRLKAAKTPFPLVTKVEDALCTGCFLKVSGEQLDDLKNPTEPVFCEQCGRMIFI